MFALEVAQQQQQQLEHQQQEQQQPTKHETVESGAAVADQEDDDVSNSSMGSGGGGGATSPPPSVAPSTPSSIGDRPNNHQVNNNNGGEEESRQHRQSLFVHSTSARVNSSMQMAASVLLNNVQHHRFINAASVTTPVVSPLASPIASPQPSSYHILSPSDSTTVNPASWTSSSVGVPSPSLLVRDSTFPQLQQSFHSANLGHQHTATSNGGVLPNQQDLLLQPGYRPHSLPSLARDSSFSHQSQQQHPLPHILPQHPFVQPPRLICSSGQSFSSTTNVRTDPTVPPGCREHGFNLIGQKYLLHDQIEGSHLQRCIQVDSQREYVCKVSFLFHTFVPS